MTMEIQVPNESDRHHHSNTDATIIKSKGKRTRRPRPPSPLALTMACSSSSDSEARTFVPSHWPDGEDSDPTTTATAAAAAAATTTMSRHSPESAKEEEEDMANCLILLARGRGPIAPRPASDRNINGRVEASCAFSCKTCSRSFPSFQALGGHRASHKKPKLDHDHDKNSKPAHVTMKGNDVGEERRSVAACTALSLQITPGAAPSSSGNRSSNKVHECSICGAEFNSGQALGGHMRRHRAAMPGSRVNDTEPEIKKGRHGQGLQGLDLNLPASAAEEGPEAAAAGYAFASKEKVLVLSTSPLTLVDCHY